MFFIWEQDKKKKSRGCHFKNIFQKTKVIIFVVFVHTLISFFYILIIILFIHLYLTSYIYRLTHSFSDKLDQNSIEPELDRLNR